ncbi:hypothetical protein [Enhygromyxa salina]|uniref:Lysozyme inhibitor LprI N-terminal domain-containing protein n=1 Tax=Enhygromyxa salina TaxID=215803 RepID=A0A2S9YT75_9BACT|nr:hypothetical protein [Enhygromyxa salina]PRQ08270.1 hypothetical protein ENSA7_18920 [Enhygromyxa salina]
MLNRLSASLLLAVLTLAACGPSAEDEVKMKEKMALESARAELMLTATDCEALEVSLTEFKSTNADRLTALDTWWVALGDGAKDKLIEAHQTEWDAQTGAMIKASACAEAIKAGF